MKKKKLEKKSPKQKVDNSSLFRDWRKLKTLRIICIPRIPDCLGVTVFWLCKSICACVCVCVWTTNIKAKGAISMVTVQYELVWLMWMYPLDPSSHRMYVCMCECLFRKKGFFFRKLFFLSALLINAKSTYSVHRQHNFYRVSSFIMKTLSKRQMRL